MPAARAVTRRPRRLRLTPGPIVITAEGHQDLSAYDDYTVRPVSGRAGWVEPSPIGGSGKGGMEMWGEAILRNGDTVLRIRNKITGQGLRHLANLGIVGTNSLLSQNSGGGTYRLFHTNSMTESYIRVGTGAGATVEGTTTLVTPIAINPSSTLIAYANPSVGVYQTKFTATWNSGVLPASTITEIGIFGALAVGAFPSTINADTLAGLTNLALFARLSTADGEFTAFTINTTVPLTIEYRVVYTYT